MDREVMDREDLGIAQSGVEERFGLSEEFFTSCVSAARESSLLGETGYHLIHSFGQKFWHNQVANFRERLMNESLDWSFRLISNLPVFVNNVSKKAFFISPPAINGVLSNQDITLRRCFGKVARGLCDRNNLQLQLDLEGSLIPQRGLPFGSEESLAPQRRLPQEYEVWALVRQLVSRDGEILLELVKFTSDLGIVDRIRLPIISALQEQDVAVSKAPSVEVSADIDIDITRRG